MSVATDSADPFGIYRAEWLQDALFKLFTKPAYYPELETPRPCVLVGGRGTGKTTVLRCLSYEGRYALEGEKRENINLWPYYGFYYRVNTNRVTAFKGQELDEERWRRAFAHYVNLLLCGQMLQFCGWYKLHSGLDLRLPEAVCAELSAILYVDEANDIESLIRAVGVGCRSFENFLNNIQMDSFPRLSLQGAPIDYFAEELLKIGPFKDKKLFFIVDEFENFEDYQQEILNTLIKHCGAFYTFKIGVKELGWRRRTTSNPNEQLQSPADYERIDIAQRLEGERFAAFAEEVCNVRAGGTHSNIPSLLPGLSSEEEAERLGVRALANQILSKVRRADMHSFAEKLSPLELYFVGYWSSAQNQSVEDVLRFAEQKPKEWGSRFENHKVAALFTIRGGLVGLRKFYCGWRTYVLMADGNIRYLLELVGQARLLQREEGQSNDQKVSPEIQTKGAQAVGRKNLLELEGLSVHGAQLTKLLLGLGRIFEVLAAQPEGHTPEITQFHLPDDSPITKSAESLLTSAVMHLALVRSVSSKRMNLDLKSFDYAVHPIYSAFFTFSHRKKRKMALSPHQLVALVEEPKAAIRQVLRQHERSDDYPLPEQLRLFEEFYVNNAA